MDFITKFITANYFLANYLFLGEYDENSICFDFDENKTIININEVL